MRVALPGLNTLLLLLLIVTEASADQSGPLSEMSVTIPRTLKQEHLASEVGTSLIKANQLIRSNLARQKHGVTGAGYSVAVIDTGIDYNHPDLGGGWGNKIIAGWNFLDDNSDPMDVDGHGTHVAGIIAGNGYLQGIAPEANLIALKTMGSGETDLEYTRQALQWVIEHQKTYNIVAVNLSLGTGNFRTLTDASWEEELNALIRAGVVVVAATGNDFYEFESKRGMGFPAASPATISVGAVWTDDFGEVNFGGAIDYTTAADRITSFTQRSPLTDLMAPGAMILSMYPNNEYEMEGGTSMAAPVVTGAAVLARQMMDLTDQGDRSDQCSMVKLFKESGITIIDGDDEDDSVKNTGLSFQRIDLLNALNVISETAYPEAPENPGQLDSRLAEVRGFVPFLRNRTPACLGYKMDRHLERFSNELEVALQSSNFNADQAQAIGELKGVVLSLLSGSDPLAQRRNLNRSLLRLSRLLKSDAIDSVEFVQPRTIEELLRQLAEGRYLVRVVNRNVSHDEQQLYRHKLAEFSQSLRLAIKSGDFHRNQRRQMRRFRRSVVRLTSLRQDNLQQRKQAFRQSANALNRVLIRRIRIDNRTRI